MTVRTAPIYPEHFQFLSSRWRQKHKKMIQKNLNKKRRLMFRNERSRNNEIQI